MTFALGQKSKQKLIGVHPDLVRVVERAITISEADFSVHEGLRSIETQREYVRTGVSKTMNSRHLTGHAVDLVPFIAGQLRWEWAPIFKIADAIDIASTGLGIPIRWGAVWDKLLSDYGGSPEKLKAESDAYCLRHAGKDFLDGPHFELPASLYP